MCTDACIELAKLKNKIFLKGNSSTEFPRSARIFATECYAI